MIGCIRLLFVVQSRRAGWHRWLSAEQCVAWRCLVVQSKRLGSKQGLIQWPGEHKRNIQPIGFNLHGVK
eukprot:9338019-Pyramimonas_sp.AAC.2